MHFYIYYHIDPQDYTIRYIGKGSKRRAWKFSSRKGHHQNWINQLKNKNLLPIVEIVKYFENEEEAFAKEKELIKAEKETNLKLCNATDGGEGCAGLKGEKAGCYGRTGSLHPMYGKKHSEETRKKISERHTGSKRNPEVGKKISISKKGKNFVSAEGRKRQIEKIKGRKATLEQRKKQSLAQMGLKHNQRKVIDLETGIVYDNAKECADCYLINLNTFYARLKRKNKKRFIYL